MTLSAETAWPGGPRSCLLHRRSQLTAAGPGSRCCRHSSPSLQPPVLSYRANSSELRHQSHSQVACGLANRCCSADWKSRKRKAAACHEALMHVGPHCGAECRLTSAVHLPNSVTLHHSWRHIENQLDRRRVRGLCGRPDGSVSISAGDDHPPSVPAWSDAGTPSLQGNSEGRRYAIDRDLEAESEQDDRDPQPTEAGILPESRLPSGQAKMTWPSRPIVMPAPKLAEALNAASTHSLQRPSNSGLVYSAAQRNQIRDSWSSLVRWSRILRGRGVGGSCVSERIDKVVVFGGGSFGTAMAAVLARQRPHLQVVLLLRDPYTCHSINHEHKNTRYLAGYELPHNLVATTSMSQAISGAQYAVHALPVQQTRSFLTSIKDILPPDVPLISVSKGLELGTGKMMSEIIPAALGRKHPAVFLSGPSFAREVMDLRPTGIVAASKDLRLAKEAQQLFASSAMRVNTTSDVVGVELCGSLKNVLAIAAGIVEGLELGNNAMAALVTQGCSEIRWLAEKAGAKPATVAGLSGLGDIMLTCYGTLSRNRAVGVRLGKGESLEDILKSSKQVAEGVPTAGVVVGLGRKYRVSLPVLTAVAQVLNSHLRADQAVAEIMSFPQIEER